MRKNTLVTIFVILFIGAVVGCYWSSQGTEKSIRPSIEDMRAMEINQVLKWYENGRTTTIVRAPNGWFYNDTYGGGCFVSETK